MGTPSITHTHTHPFNGPLSGTTRVSQYQKGKTNLDFAEARDSEWQWHQLGCAYSSVHLAPDRQPRQHPTAQVFLHVGCPSCCPTNSVKALQDSLWTCAFTELRLQWPGSKTGANSHCEPVQCSRRQCSQCLKNRDERPVNWQSTALLFHRRNTDTAPVSALPVD